MEIVQMLRLHHALVVVETLLRVFPAQKMLDLFQTERGSVRLLLLSQASGNVTPVPALSGLVGVPLVD